MPKSKMVHEPAAWELRDDDAVRAAGLVRGAFLDHVHDIPDRARIDLRVLGKEYHPAMLHLARQLINATHTKERT